MATDKDARIDQELIKALAHPLRVEILEALQERVGSPSELSKEMQRSLGVVAYHTNMLVECDCLELVDTEQRRGALEHFYRAKPRSYIGHQDWRRAPRSLRGEVTDAAFASFLDKAAAAAEAGTIDGREGTTLSWMPMTVDENGWNEIAAIMSQALKQLTGVHERSRERLVPGLEIPVVIGLAGFEASGAGEAPQRG